MAKERNVQRPHAALSQTMKPIADHNVLATTDTMENMVAGLGGSRDKRSFSYFGQPRKLTRNELENMFVGSWLGKRIVNAVAEDMTREWVNFQFDDTDDEDDRQFVVEEEVKKWDLRNKVTDAIRWARLYGGCLILIGTKDKDMSKPFDKTKVKKGDLLFLHVMDRWRIAPSGQIDQDMTSKNFGNPATYVVAESSVIVHHTRVVRFDGERLPYFLWRANGMWHDSSLQHVLDSLLNCDSVSQSIATMFFEANVDVVTSEGLADTLASKDGTERITKRYQLAATMKSFNRMLLLDGKEKYEKKTNSFANLEAVWKQFMVDVCGAADIPMTRLFGQSPGGLNSTGDGDIRNYYDMIKAKQTAGLNSQLETLLEVIIRNALGTMPEDFRFEFNPLWQVSATEQATIEKTNADRDKIYLDAGVVKEETIAKDLKENGVYPNMTDDDIADIAELSEAMNENGIMGVPPTGKGAVPPNPDDPNALPVDPKAPVVPPVKVKKEKPNAPK